MSSPEMGLKQIEAARDAVWDQYTRTPSFRLAAVDELLGGQIALKAENLQQSGSFKLRGASNKLFSLGAACADGVVAGTAGNHGRALAYAARRRGVPCHLYVPHDAPISKTEPAAELGAVVERCEGGVDDCVVRARERAAADGLAFVHPFDDPAVVAGQGTIGLELLEDVPDLTRVVVPIGGGGLAAGVAIAVKSQRPEAEVVGVRIENPETTVADGIAVKHPGELTAPLLERWLDEVVVVSDDETGDAMAALLAEGKLVVEGAGAVGVAALASGRAAPAQSGTTAVILSGGNIDETLLAAIARRAGARRGRGAVLYTTIPDRPGSLAQLLEAVGSTGASVVDVRHVRDAVELHVAETGVELILETRDQDHTDAIVVELGERGYVVQRQLQRQLTAERSEE
jgi:threonine dehydratase